MRLLRRSALTVLSLLLMSSPAWGGELEGLWQEFDDDTGKVVALIRIEKTSDNTFEGRIEKLIPDARNTAESVCEPCKDALHHAPLVGLRILSGMKRRDRHHYDGGTVLDPDDGNIYACHIRLSDDGNTLEVTGYIQVNWIGQSEIWVRAR